MKTSLTRTVHFRASHRYWIAEWSDEANRAHFGAATEAHPHDYTCAVTVSGVLDPETDMVIELPALDKLIETEVVARFHDKDLNRDTPEFAEGGMLPSCEALARYCFMRIAEQLPAGVTLERVRIAEDASLHADCVATPE